MCGAHRHRVRRYGDPQAHIPIAYTGGRILTLPLSETGGTGRPIYEDRDWCEIAFYERLLTFREMADEAGCGLRTIARWVHRHGFDVPNAAERRLARDPSFRKEPRPPRYLRGPKPRCACGREMSYEARQCIACQNAGGVRHHSWTGDEVGYAGAHFRVKALWGFASTHTCRHCLGPAAHWAYDHLDPNERVDPDEGPYSPNPDHYLPLCVRCHKAFDLGYLARQRRAAAAS